jgi:hypothetical protein
LRLNTYRYQRITPNASFFKNNPILRKVNPSVSAGAKNRSKTHRNASPVPSRRVKTASNGGESARNLELIVSGDLHEQVGAKLGSASPWVRREVDRVIAARAREASETFVRLQVARLRKAPLATP